jgi:ketosteroid isomerase-like protein
MTAAEHSGEQATLTPAAEIHDLITRFYKAASTNDVERLDGVISRQPETLWIGTDPNEWWTTPEAVFKAWRAEAAEAGGPATITGGGATAYQHGDVAWVSDRPTFQLPDGRRLPFRFTAVCLREPGGWRIVQAHASFGVANDAVRRAA